MLGLDRYGRPSGPHGGRLGVDRVLWDLLAGEIVDGQLDLAGLGDLVVDDGVAVKRVGAVVFQGQGGRGRGLVFLRYEGWWWD